MKAGPVREFARYRPPLVELYRHVVSATAEPDDVPTGRR
jgi:hypothetical protein